MRLARQNKHDRTRPAFCALRRRMGMARPAGVCDHQQRGIEGNTVFYDQGRAADVALCAPVLQNAESVVFVYTGPNIEDIRSAPQFTVARDDLVRVVDFLSRVSDVFAGSVVGDDLALSLSEMWRGLSRAQMVSAQTLGAE